MTIKHAVANIPAGGGKGGIKVNPDELSEGELERLTRAYIRKLPLKGSWTDIPGADIGTNARIQAWMLDEYEEIAGFHSPAAINDKPAVVGGSLGSMEATGTGAFHVTVEAMRDAGINQDARIAIQGFGNVGRIIAGLLNTAGLKIIAVSDIKGGIYSEKGIDIHKLTLHVGKNGSVIDFAGATWITNEELLETECDLLIPSAIQSVITAQNARKVKARLILECANGPITPEGEAILREKGTMIVPDVVANCGSAIVCSFERTQCLTDDYWHLDSVLERLRARIVQAYKDTFTTAREMNTSFRNAAWANALWKIGRAMQARGWI